MWLQVSWPVHVWFPFFRPPPIPKSYLAFRSLLMCYFWGEPAWTLPAGSDSPVLSISNARRAWMSLSLPIQRLLHLAGSPSVPAPGLCTVPGIGRHPAKSSEWIQEFTGHNFISIALLVLGEQIRGDNSRCAPLLLQGDLGTRHLHLSLTFMYYLLSLGRRLGESLHLPPVSSDHICMQTLLSWGGGMASALLTMTEKRESKL